MFFLNVSVLMLLRSAVTQKEILLMSLLHHPNVVRILSSFVDGAFLWIVMPYLQGGSCAAAMKEVAPNGFKDEALIATILRDAILGLEYLHRDDRIHRSVPSQWRSGKYHWC